MTSRIFCRAVLLAAVWCAAGVPAHAAEYCDILGGPDGFADLRASPDTGSRLIARMHPGDEVRPLEGRQGAWIEVYFWHGADRLNAATRDHRLHGWVISRYIGETCG
jgi:hypothetical protein